MEPAQTEHEDGQGLEGMPMKCRVVTVVHYAGLKRDSGVVYVYDEISTETRKIFYHIINVSGDHAVGLLSYTAMIAGVCRKSSFVCVR